MAAAGGGKAHEEDIESGAGPLRFASPAAGESDGSVGFSDAEVRSRRSHGEASSRDDLRLSCGAPASAHEGGAAAAAAAASPEPYRGSCVSDSSSSAVEIIDLENGSPEEKIKAGKPDKDCRICQMKLVGGSPESVVPIELGCSCKGDLAAAHKECAETWFKIRGNRTCEICGEAARNVAGELMEHGNETSSGSPPAPAAEQQRFWRGHRFVNFLLACMVFAFVISWLFHFNGPG